MPRHETTPQHADARLTRPHPDLLPTHRLCNHCAQVLPLNAEHFYTDSRRFPWQLSRYGPACKPCTSQANGATRAARKPLRNAQERKRRALDKANRRTAAYFFSPEWLAIKAREDEDARERKMRKAWAKRQFNRMRGPYRDPIKAMIRERQAEAMRRRLGGPGGPRESSDAQTFDAERRDHPALLQALRDKHRAEALPRAAPLAVTTSALTTAERTHADRHIRPAL